MFTCLPGQNESTKRLCTLINTMLDEKKTPTEIQKDTFAESLRTLLLYYHEQLSDPLLASLRPNFGKAFQYNGSLAEISNPNLGNEFYFGELILLTRHLKTIEYVIPCLFPKASREKASENFFQHALHLTNMSHQIWHFIVHYDQTLPSDGKKSCRPEYKDMLDARSYFESMCKESVMDALYSFDQFYGSTPKKTYLFLYLEAKLKLFKDQEIPPSFCRGVKFFFKTLMDKMNSPYPIFSKEDADLLRSLIIDKIIPNFPSGKKGASLFPNDAYMKKFGEMFSCVELISSIVAAKNAKVEESKSQIKGLDEDDTDALKSTIRKTI